jgi:hypothetical protein
MLSGGRALSRGEVGRATEPPCPEGRRLGPSGYRSLPRPAATARRQLSPTCSPDGGLVKNTVGAFCEATPPCRARTPSLPQVSLAISPWTLHSACSTAARCPKQLCKGRDTGLTSPAAAGACIASSHAPCRPCSLSGRAIPRRSMCDDVAGEAVEATRLRRVLHCVPVPGATQASLGMPQASSPPRYAHAGGGLASAGTTKGSLSWLPSER